MASKSSTQLLIAKVFDEIKNLVLLKNLEYGDSALNPIRVFSRASTIEQIWVRCDDKLSRIKHGNALIESDPDVIKDLIGYLGLYLVHLEMEQEAAEADDSFENPYYSYDNLGELDSGAFNPWGSDYYDGYLKTVNTDLLDYASSYRQGDKES
jgi:hypothetical protein